MSDRRRITFVDGDVLWRCVRLICWTWAYTAAIAAKWGQPYGGATAREADRLEADDE